MLGLLISYFFVMSAFMLTLDFPISFSALVSILIVHAICLHKHFDVPVNRFLANLRSVCRIE